jgi:hypothetical protein
MLGDFLPVFLNVLICSYYCCYWKNYEGLLEDIYYNPLY